MLLKNNENIKTYDFLGINVAKLTTEKLFDIIHNCITNDRKLVIAYQNLHGLYLLKNQNLYNFYNDKDTITLIDGMSLVLIGKILKYDLNTKYRLAWIDFTQPLLTLAIRNKWRIFYLGSSEDAIVTIKQKLSEQYKLSVECNTGYFDVTPVSNDNKRVIDKINLFKPDILIVGMGMPRQEMWIYVNKELINTKLIMCCGAAFEFLAGTAKTPPRWLGKLGLEWFYRLISNPRKLWYRYIIEPWFVLVKLFNYKARHKSR